MERGGHMLELTHGTFFLVIALLESTSPRCHAMEADFSFSASEGHQVFQGMAGQRQNGFAGAGGIVDQMATSHIDEFHPTISTDGNEFRTIVGKGRAKNPVEVVITLHQASSVRSVEGPHQLVGPAHGETGAIVRPRDSVEGVGACPNGADEGARSHVP